MCAVSNAPSWLVGHALNEWFEIPGTGGVGGVDIDAYNGIAVRESNSEIVVAAGGEAKYGGDNRVVSLILSVDAPTWVTRKAASANPIMSVSHYADGAPAARYLYQNIHAIESLHRVFLFGAEFVYGGSNTFPDVDAFDLNTNQWDPAGMWAPVPMDGAYGVVRIRGSEDVYTGGLHRWSAATQTWSQPITTRTLDEVRFPIAHDSKRNQLFSLQWADGQSASDMRVNASRIPLGGDTQIHVTIAPSAAYSQFQQEQPAYASMDYDPDQDRFLFYAGHGSGAGRVYVIQPNATDTWDMSLFQVGPGSATVPETPGGGIQNRFRYVPQFKGFMLLPNRMDNIFFLRTC
jgi:hypothetical protein